MIKTIIIDDEVSAQETLAGMLKVFCPDVMVLGIAGSANSARELVKEYNPDLIFLDIKMPFENGFEFLESLEELRFNIIFTTAYNNYALKAIKFSALDYLLKPINVDELVLAVKKASKRTIHIDQYQILKEYQQNPNSNRIVLPYKSGIRIVNSIEIIRIEGVRNYSRVHLINSEKILVAKTLKEFEQLLDFSLFYRVHQSNIVNLKCVTAYIKGRGGQIQLIDNSIINLARSRKQEFISLLNKQ